MADSKLNNFVSRGTNAQRVAFTPSPPTPASGNSPGYFFYETDTGNTYSWDGAAWQKVNNSSGSVGTTGTPASGNLAKFSGTGTITNGDLSGDITTSGTLAATLAASGVAAGTYGDGTHTLTATVDAKGRVTSVSTNAISAGLRLFSAFSPVGTGTVTTEQDLITFSLPAGTLASDGQAIRIRIRGQYANVARSRQLRLYFGATDIGFFSSAAGSAFNIDIDAIVIRSGAATQRATANVIGAVNNTTTATAIFQSQTTPGETLSGSVIIKVTGQAAATAVANDVVCDLFLVELLP